MPKKTDRREFLKKSSAAVAGIAAGGILQTGCSKNSEVKSRENYLPEKTEWFPSTCRICQANCGIIVKSIDDVMLKIEGNPVHPVNLGKLCVRGQGALKQMLSKNRITEIILKRSNKNGDSYIKSIRKLMEDPDVSIALIDNGRDTFRNRMLASYFNKYRNFSYYKEDTYNPPDGRDGNFGSEVSGIGMNDVIISFGDPIEASPSRVSLQRELSLLRSGDGKHRGIIYHVSPRISSIGSKADEWILINPGTEYHFLIGIMMHLIELIPGSVSKEKIEKYIKSDSNDKKGHESISKKTGIAFSVIKELALKLARAESPRIYFNDNMVWSQNDRLVRELLTDINMFLREVKGIKSDIEPELFSKYRELIYSLNSPPGKPLSDFFDKLGKGMFPDILFISGGDPFYNSPQTSDSLNLIGKIKNIISITPYETVTANYATMVIPDLHFLEKYDMSPDLSSSGQLIININIPVIDRYVKKIKDPLIIIGELTGSRDSEIKQEILSRIDSFYKIFKNKIRLRHEDFIEQLLNRSSWSVMINDETGANPVKSVTKNVSAAPPLPVESVYKKLTPEFPFVLYPFRTMCFEEGMSSNQPWLRQIYSSLFQEGWEFWAELDEARALQYGLKDGDMIWIENRSKKRIKAKLKVSNMIHPDIIAVPLGFGNSELNKIGGERGYSVLNLLSGEKDGTGRYIHLSESVKIYRSMES